MCTDRNGIKICTLVKAYIDVNICGRKMCAVVERKYDTMIFMV